MFTDSEGNKGIDEFQITEGCPTLFCLIQNMPSPTTPKLFSKKYHTKPKSGTAQKSIVLIADGCDLKWLDEFDSAASDAGELLNYISLFRQNKKLNYSNLLFGDIDETAIPKLLIIPSGDDCLKQLLVDPRVHRLFARTIAHSGKIALAAGAELILARIPFELRTSSKKLFFQRNLTPAEFATQLFSC